LSLSGGKREDWAGGAIDIHLQNAKSNSIFPHPISQEEPVYTSYPHIFFFQEERLVLLTSLHPFWANNKIETHLAGLGS
jgi:hypothetical protein